MWACAAALFPWPHPVEIGCSDPALQRLFDASVNTLYNSAIETVVDGMGRERQQYSGDGGHQLIAIRSVLGEPRLSARFLRTFSEGLTKDGYFLDCWPAYDRLARWPRSRWTEPIGDRCWTTASASTSIAGITTWKPATAAALAEPYPRLVRFAEYLISLRDENGLLPVENLGNSDRVDRPRCVPSAAAQAVRVQPVRRGDVPARAGADGRSVRRRGASDALSPAG